MVKKSYCSPYLSAAPQWHWQQHFFVSSPCAMTNTGSVWVSLSALVPTTSPTVTSLKPESASGLLVTSFLRGASSLLFSAWPFVSGVGEKLKKHQFVHLCKRTKVNNDTLNVGVPESSLIILFFRRWRALFGRNRWHATSRLFAQATIETVI